MQREAEQEVRKRLSTVENMPFLDIEDAPPLHPPGGVFSYPP